MSAALIFHADADAFYCSVERVFRPDLRKKPVAVLSCTDSSVVSRTKEAKPFLPAGAPIFQYRQVVEQQGIALFSSNFPLYADFSLRMLSILGEFAEAIEQYSIDECFLTAPITDSAEATAFGKRLHDAMFAWLGLPVSIGIANTKTRAKIATKLAKDQGTGVYVLHDEEVESVLASLDVQDVWGIGPKKAQILHSHRLHSALELARAPDRWLRQYLSVTTLRTAWELRGTACLPLELAPSPKKQLACTHTFGRSIEDLKELKEALANYVIAAAARLRKQQSLATMMGVFIATNPFKPSEPQYHRSCAVRLAPTAATPELITAAHHALEQIYKPGFRYYRAGVFLWELIRDEPRQLELFSRPETLQRQQQVMQLVDAINLRMGRGTISFAAAKTTKQEWKPQAAYESPHYTTRLSDLPTVR